MWKETFFRGGKQPRRRRIIRCLILFATLLASAQAHAQQGPTGPFYDKLGSLEPTLGPVAEPCKGPRLIAATNPVNFEYKESEGSATRTSLKMDGTLGLCMRHFVAGVFGQYSDVKRGSKLVPGYGPDGSQLGPWWESRDLYVTAQVGGRAILPSRGDLLHHEFLFLARGQVYEERDFKTGCESGQCPWFVSGMPLYRLGLGVLRLNVGGSLDYSQFVTDWFERNPSHTEEGFGSRRLSFSGLGRLGLRLGKEKSVTLDLFAEAAFTAPLMQEAGPAGRVYRVGGELAVPLYTEEDGLNITFNMKAGWAQHFVPETDCNAPERAGAPCYYKGFHVGPAFVAKFDFPLMASERRPAKTEPEPKPEPDPTPPPKAPEPKPEPKPEVVPVLPPVVTPVPAPEPAKACIGVYDRADAVVRTVVSEDSGCVEKQTLFRLPSDDPKEALPVSVCRAGRGGITAITDTKSGRQLTCADILGRWANRPDSRMEHRP